MVLINLEQGMLEPRITYYSWLDEGSPSLREHALVISLTELVRVRYGNTRTQRLKHGLAVEVDSRRNIDFDLINVGVTPRDSPYHMQPLLIFIMTAIVNKRPCYEEGSLCSGDNKVCSLPISWCLLWHRHLTSVLAILTIFKRLNELGGRADVSKP